MKRQSTGIVLCALLLTTFGHEILSRHQIAHSAKQSHLHGKSHVISRDNNLVLPSNCYRVCPHPGGNLTLAINSTTNIVAVYNVTAKIGLVLDIKASLAAIINFQTGSAIILNLNDTTRIVEVKIQGSNDFNSWYQNFKGLKDLYQQGRQVTSSQVSATVQLALSVLSNGEYQISAQESLEVFISICVSLNISFGKVISVITSGISSVRVTLAKLVKVITGFSAIIGHIRGGIGVILEHHVTISLEAIVTAPSGFQLLGYIWEQLIASDLIDLFGGLENSTSVLGLVLGLGGNTTEGVTGLVDVLFQIILLVNGKGCIHTFIEVLVEFLSSNDDDVYEHWKADVDSLYNLIIRLNLTKRLKVVFSLLTAIRERRWIENGVNMSAIIKILFHQQNSSKLNVIIKIFNILKARVSINLLVSGLVLYFIDLLTVTGGIQILVAITGIHVSAEILNAGANALSLIVKSLSNIQINIRTIIRALFKLPVIGEILVAINAALKIDISANVNVEGALTTSGNIKIIIQIILYALHDGLTTIRPIQIPFPLPNGSNLTNGTNEASATVPVIDVVGEPSAGGAVASGNSTAEQDSNTTVNASGGDGGNGGGGGDVNLVNSTVNAGDGGSISGSGSGNGGTGVGQGSSHGGSVNIGSGSGGAGGTGGPGIALPDNSSGTQEDNSSDSDENHEDRASHAKQAKHHVKGKHHAHQNKEHQAV